MPAPRRAGCFAALALALSGLTSCCCAIKDRRLLDVTTPGDTQTSIKYDSAFGPGTQLGLPLNSGPLKRTVTDFQPEGIHLTPYGRGKVLISWQTGAPRAGPASSPPRPHHPSSVRAKVYYGKISGNYAYKAVGHAADSLVYEYVYGKDAGGFAYQSPILHHVLLKGLEPGHSYYYKVGNDEDGFSPEYSFTVPNDDASRIRIAVFGDLGDTANSSQTLKNVIKYNADLVLNMGDFTYADQHPSNASEDDGHPLYFFKPRWDGWARLLQPLLASVPMLSVAGNHETEVQSANGYWTYTAYNARHPQPTDGNNIVTTPNNLLNYLDASNYNQFINEATVQQNNSYYDITVGPVHIFGLDSYLPYGPTSQQVRWFKQASKRVDRVATPWVVVFYHTAAYHTYSNHFRENDAFLAVFEPLFKEVGVDIVMGGHVHAYERTYGVYNYTRDDCAPVYITIGDGGNIEGLYQAFIDEQPINAYCSKGNSSLYSLPPYQPTPTGQTVITYPASFNNSFCPNSQPDYSAFREPAFGSGLLEVLTPTKLAWTWHRTTGPGSAPEVVDSVTITKSPNCPNQLPGKAQPHAWARASAAAEKHPTELRSKWGAQEEAFGSGGLP